ncbi:unnamed protein product [Penicillium salamii]|uniref:Beta-glucuronidase C-terminal domain-containing protein n=1 Tax=Penicillium salamii TaxID=1612424 RepID=A0A9W4MY90_9EURO|nr:unnamed protein product [Penicillium salamii]
MLLTKSKLLAVAVFFESGRCQHQLSIPPIPKDSHPIPHDFQSISIEFAFFPDYAGNKSHPNRFTKNLLQNFKSITRVAPKVRVGGTSQDHATYYPEQESNIDLVYQNPGDDQPFQINYGPAFFESYHTLGEIKYLHGLNMNQNTSVEQLEISAMDACTALGPQLHLFELGNEFNFAPGKYRASNYSLLDYANEWNLKSEIVKTAVDKACPGLFPGFMAPSLVLLDFIVNTTWTGEELYSLGYDENNLTRELCFHNYMGVNSPPQLPAPFDLQRTLMNHTSIVQNLHQQIQRAENLAYLGLPYTLGELNSIANQGRNGATNVFGDALWLVDFSLWAAEHGMKRLHFHQGLNYRYASWQPIGIQDVPPTTRPPYYGQIMVAHAVEDPHSRIVNIPLADDTESAYAIYNGTQLSKLVVTNLRAFNQTTINRPIRKYEFTLPAYQSARIDRLIGPGSDAVGNITFGGISYDHALDEGKPVRVRSEETTRIKHGVLRVEVPDSSAVLITLLSPGHHHA